MVSNVSHWQTLQCSDFSRPHASLPSRTPGLLQPAVIEVLSIFIAGYSYCPSFLKRMRACCLQPPGVPCTSTVLWCMLAHTCHSRGIQEARNMAAVSDLQADFPHSLWLDSEPHVLSQTQFCICAL